jgi:hypothetical protein
MEYIIHGTKLVRNMFNAQDVFCAKGQLFPLLDISDGVNFKSVLVRSEAKKNWLLTSDPRCSNVVAMANPTIS